jgi:hypothetical protein
VAGNETVQRVNLGPPVREPGRRILYQSLVFLPKGIYSNVGERKKGHPAAMITELTAHLYESAYCSERFATTCASGDRHRTEWRMDDL